MASNITLNADKSLTDSDIGPHFSAGSITDFGGQCEGHLWIVPVHGGPRMYTADNLRQIAEILDAADQSIKDEDLQ